MARGPVELVAGEDVEIDVERLHVDRQMGDRLATVEQHLGAGGMRQPTISETGRMVPSTFDIWLIATSLVRSLSKRSTWASGTAPSAAIGTTWTMPFSSRSSCQGTMFE